jgi:hypothetical protein
MITIEKGAVSCKFLLDAQFCLVYWIRSRKKYQGSLKPVVLSSFSTILGFFPTI